MNEETERERVKDFIRWYVDACDGIENAVNGKILAQAAGVSTREIVSLASELRREDYPILATVKPPYEYYKAIKPEDFDAYYALLKGRIRANAITLREVAALDPRNDVEPVATTEDLFDPAILAILERDF